jgi:hypothetical protein
MTVCFCRLVHGLDGVGANGVGRRDQEAGRAARSADGGQEGEELNWRSVRMSNWGLP